MSTLPDRRILEYGAQLISPFNAEQVQPASYDLRLGWEFIRFRTRDWHLIDLADLKDSSHEKIVAEDQYVIAPGEFLLGVTVESVKIPPNIVARLEGKSTIGRTGLMIHVTAGFIDPGFHGPITLEIFNCRRVPIILRPGLPFCQISFAYMEPADKPYSGRYQNAQGVEASKRSKDKVSVIADDGRPLDDDDTGITGYAVPPCEQRDGFGGLA